MLFDLISRIDLGNSEEICEDGNLEYLGFFHA